MNLRSWTPESGCVAGNHAASDIQHCQPASINRNFVGVSDIRCIGIGTGGGDPPGLNAVIRAVVKSAILKYKWKVIGILDGLDALIWPERSVELTLKSVSGILPRGGTILGTTNSGNPFQYKTVENGQETVRDISDEVMANARKLGMDAVITVGGDGSQKIALALFQKGMKIVAVPKTIDNDLCATDVTFGFDTAVTTATDAVDKIHTTAESHHRVMVIEVMGRDAWLDRVAFRHCRWRARHPDPGNSIHPAKRLRSREASRGLWQAFHHRGRRGRHHLPPEMKHMSRSMPVGRLMGDTIALLSRKDVRVSVLGHIQRGGSLPPYDRVLGTRFGVAAVDLIAAGGFGKTVCLKGEHLCAVDIGAAIGHMKSIDPRGELWPQLVPSEFFWRLKVPSQFDSLRAKLLKVGRAWFSGEKRPCRHRVECLPVALGAFWGAIRTRGDF